LIGFYENKQIRILLFFILQMLYGNRPDETFRTYYTSCQQNRCNGHNGRVKNSTNGAGGSGIHNAIVPGKNAGQGVSFTPWPLFVILIPALWQLT